MSGATLIPPDRNVLVEGLYPTKKLQKEPSAEAAKWKSEAEDWKELNAGLKRDAAIANARAVDLREKLAKSEADRHRLRESIGALYCEKWDMHTEGCEERGLHATEMCQVCRVQRAARKSDKKVDDALETAQAPKESGLPAVGETVEHLSKYDRRVIGDSKVMSTKGEGFWSDNGHQAFFFSLENEGITWRRAAQPAATTEKSPVEIGKNALTNCHTDMPGHNAGIGGQALLVDIAQPAATPEQPKRRCQCQLEAGDSPCPVHSCPICDGEHDCDQCRGNVTNTVCVSCGAKPAQSRTANLDELFSFNSIFPPALIAKVKKLANADIDAAVAPLQKRIAELEGEVERYRISAESWKESSYRWKREAEQGSKITQKQKISDLSRKWFLAERQKDKDGNLTPLALACQALRITGCDCIEGETNRCLGCLCEKALYEQFKRIHELENQ